MAKQRILIEPTRFEKRGPHAFTIPVHAVGDAEHFLIYRQEKRPEGGRLSILLDEAPTLSDALNVAMSCARRFGKNLNIKLKGTT